MFDVHLFSIPAGKVFGKNKVVHDNVNTHGSVFFYGRQRSAAGVESIGRIVHQAIIRLLEHNQTFHPIETV